jgi:hypothetical protein
MDVYPSAVRKKPWNTRKHVYLASSQGTLFVLDNAEPNFPVIATIQVSAQPGLA